MVGFDDLQDEAENQSNGSSERETDAGIPDDWGPDQESDLEMPNVKARPNGIIAFDRLVDFDIQFKGGITDEQNFRTPSGYGGQLVLTLENPRVEGGVLYQSASEEELREIHDTDELTRSQSQSADYWVLSEDASDVEDKAIQTDDGWEKAGISINGNAFYGEQVDGFDEQFVTLWDSSQSAQRLVRTLDTLGFDAARFEDPDHENDYDSAIDGLFEFPFAYNSSEYDPEEHGYPRACRTPDMRADYVGEPLAIQYRFGDTNEQYDNRSHYADVVALNENGNPATDEDGNPVFLDMLSADDEASQPPTHSSYTVWHTPETDMDMDEGSDTEYGGDASDGDGTPEKGSIEEETGGAFGDLDDDGPAETYEYDDLGPAGQEFIDGMEEVGISWDEIEDPGPEARLDDLKDRHDDTETDLEAVQAVATEG